MPTGCNSVGPVSESLIRAAIGVALLMVITTVVLAGARVPRRWSSLLAVLRGALQLAAISLVLRGVIEEPLWVACAIVVMFAVAVVTAARRLGFTWTRLGIVAGAMALGVTVALAIVFLAGAVEVDARNVLALGGIVVGGAMTATTLAGRRLISGLGSRWAEVEAWLALGATPRQATNDIAREAVGEALIPHIDQTRTTGLVTLPGAFVGAIFGGASPLEAARFQIVVLAAILTAGALAATTLVFVLAPSSRPGSGGSR